MILPPKRPGDPNRVVSGVASRTGAGVALSIPLLLSSLLFIAQPAGAQQTPTIQDDGGVVVTDDPEADGTATRTALTQFTTAIENREPIDQITFVENDVRKIFFFSDLRGLTGTTVFHRWVYAGETRANVEFEVKGLRWRVWSSKELEPDWVGDWTVEVLTEDGETLASETFTYTASNE